MLCRPGALAVKATAEVSSALARAESSAALTRPRTAPSAAAPPAPLSMRRPKPAQSRPSTATTHTAAHSSAHEPSQPRPSTASATATASSRAGGGVAGKQKPRMVRRSSSVAATLQQRRLSEANLADSTGPTDRHRMSTQYKARLDWNTGQFEHMKREKSRKLTMELHALAEARLDGYERKFAAFDVQEIASNSKSSPHFHLEQVRQAVKTSIGAPRLV